MPSSSDHRQVFAYQDRTKLRFKGHLEQVYQRDFSDRHLPYLKLALWAATVLYFFSGVIDKALLGESASTIWIGRYLVMGPLLIGCSVMLQLNRHYRMLQQIVLFAAASAAISMIVYWWLVEAGARPFYFTGSLIILMAGLTLARLSFWYSLYLAVVVPLFALPLIYFDTESDVVHWSVYLYFYASVCGIGVAASFFLERSSRRDFLSKLLLNREQKHLQDANSHLRLLVSSDPLTGIANRRHFDHAIAEEWRRARRGRYSISLLMIDIDYFKNYNDHYGHQMGDVSLKQVAVCLSQFAKRQGDLVARYGGEEFAVILPETGFAQGKLLAESMCARIEALHLPNQGSQVSDYVTISIGGTTFLPDGDLKKENMIKSADDALYRAKAEGRNRVVWS